MSNAVQINKKNTTFAAIGRGIINVLSDPQAKSLIASNPRLLAFLAVSEMVCIGLDSFHSLQLVKKKDLFALAINSPFPEGALR